MATVTDFIFGGSKITADGDCSHEIKRHLLLERTVVLQKALESPWDCKIKPVYPKENQSWIFTGSTDAEAEAPILWPLYAKSQLIGKDPNAGKYWRQEKKWTTEDEMVGWNHRLDGHEFWASFRRWWTGKPSVLQSTGSQRVGHEKKKKYSGRKVRMFLFLDLLAARLSMWQLQTRSFQVKRHRLVRKAKASFPSPLLSSSQLQ